MSLSLTKEQSRAGYLSGVEAAAKRKLLDAINSGELWRVMVPSTTWGVGQYQQDAADVLIDSATDNYERQRSLAQMIVDGAHGADISICCKLILSTALEQFAEASVAREEADLL